MPEYPDIVVYIEALEKRILGHTLERVQISSPFLLRTATPGIDSVIGKRVVSFRRIGKRIAIGFDNDVWLVLHLMIAGRLHWKTKKNAKDLAAFEFENGLLTLTEAGTQKRASLHLISDESGLKELDPGGVEVFEIDFDQFVAAIQSSNHTLKRSLTDPHLFSGIGNAYSDEILWEAQLSPIALTQKLDREELDRLFTAIKKSLTAWANRLREETGDGFPEKVTAFRPAMAVHGRHKLPCPRCGSKVQRIRYASNETNYCPTCQTGGKLLADRALSRLLKTDWPKTAEELG